MFAAPMTGDFAYESLKVKRLKVPYSC